MTNYKLVTIGNVCEAIYSFKSKYLGKTYYIRYEDFMRAERLGHKIVKYCKSNGEYHIERKGEPLRMVHLDNLDTPEPVKRTKRKKQP